MIRFAKPSIFVLFVSIAFVVVMAFVGHSHFKTSDPLVSDEHHSSSVIERLSSPTIKNGQARVSEGVDNGIDSALVEAVVDEVSLRVASESKLSVRHEVSESMRWLSSPKGYLWRDFKRSPDEKYGAYLALRNGDVRKETVLYVQRLDSQDALVIASDGGLDGEYFRGGIVGSMLWSSDSSSLVFFDRYFTESDELDDHGRSKEDVQRFYGSLTIAIKRLDVYSGQITELTTIPSDSDEQIHVPSASLDERNVYFVTLVKNDTGLARIYEIGADGKKLLQELTIPPTTERLKVVPFSNELWYSDRSSRTIYSISFEESDVSSVIRLANAEMIDWNSQNDQLLVRSLDYSAGVEYQVLNLQTRHLVDVDKGMKLPKPVGFSGTNTVVLSGVQNGFVSGKDVKSGRLYEYTGLYEISF